MTSFYLKYLFIGPISKYNHLGGHGSNIYDFGGGRDTIQVIMRAKSISY